MIGQRYSVSNDGAVIDFTVIGKLFGQKGRGDLIGIFVDTEHGRDTWAWPLFAQDGSRLYLHNPTT